MEAAVTSSTSGGGGVPGVGGKSLPPRAQKAKAQAKLDFLSSKNDSMELDLSLTRSGSTSEGRGYGGSLDDSWHENQPSSGQQRKKRKRQKRKQRKRKGDVALSSSSSTPTATSVFAKKEGSPLTNINGNGKSHSKEDSFLPAKKKFKVLWDADHTPPSLAATAVSQPGSAGSDSSLDLEGSTRSTFSPSLPTPVGEDEETQLTSPTPSDSFSFDFGHVVEEWDKLDASSGSQSKVAKPPSLARQTSRVHFNELVEVTPRNGATGDESKAVALKTGEELKKKPKRRPRGKKTSVFSKTLPADGANKPLSPRASPAIPARIQAAAQNSSKMKTAALFHKKCLNHRVPDDHFEVPKRLALAIECLESLKKDLPDCIDLFSHPPKADLKWVKAVHDPMYIQKIRSRIPSKNSEPCHVTQSTQEMLNQNSDVWQDTYMSFASWNAALKAAGAVIQAVDLILNPTSPYRSAVCAVRPPGHHCGRKGRTGKVKSQGFCLINNVAIGAKYALLKFNLERIAVIDFDVHAGNGTEELLCGDENFFFASIHAVGKNFYPGTGLQNSGSNIMNVPLRGGAKPALFHEKFKEIIQKLKEFKPQLILLSAGFDGHKDDPIRAGEPKVGFCLTEADYTRLSRRLLKVAARFAQGRIISVMEGGYDVQPTTNALQNSFKAHTTALLNFRRSLPAAPTATHTTAVAPPPAQRPSFPALAKGVPHPGGRKLPTEALGEIVRLVKDEEKADDGGDVDVDL